MIVYVDASALVKRCVSEAGSADVNALTAGAAALATALVTRAEVASLSRGMVMGVVHPLHGSGAQARFTS